MLRATAIRDRHIAFEQADTITLDETQRHRRRLAMVSDGGVAFLLDLAETARLRHGDGIVLDDGRVFRVQAKPEALYCVRGRDAAHLLTLAWHLGNRHQAAQISPDQIFIRREPVLRAMLEGLGASVSDVDLPFEPEGGAYDDAAATQQTRHDGHGHAHNSHDAEEDHGHRHHGRDHGHEHHDH